MSDEDKPNEREIITFHSEDKLKKWDGKDLKMIENIEKWCNENDMRDMYNTYRSVPEFGTLYKPMKEYQEIDWHEIDISDEIDKKMKEAGQKQQNNDENVIKVEAERGFYDLKTKKFVFGIRICTGELENYKSHPKFYKTDRRYLSPEEKAKRQQEEEKEEKERLNSRLMLIGQFDENRQLYGLGRKMNNHYKMYEGEFKNSKLVEGKLAIQINSRPNNQNRIHTFIVKNDNITMIHWAYLSCDDDVSIYNGFKVVLDNNKFYYFERRNNTIFRVETECDNEESQIEETLVPKVEQEIFQKMEQEEYKQMKDWYYSGQDVRTYLGVDFDPIHYFFQEEQLKKYTLVRAEEKLRRYTIKDDHGKEFEMLAFLSIDEKEIKQNERKETELERYEMCLLEHQEAINLRDVYISHGKIRNTNWTRKDLLYIITRKPLTLHDIYNDPKSEEFSTEEMLDICFKTVRKAKEYMLDRNMLLTCIQPQNIHYDEEFKGFVRITEMVKNISEFKERCEFNWRIRQDYAFNQDSIREREGVLHDKHFYSDQNLRRQEGSKMSVFTQIFYILLMVVGRGSKKIQQIKEEHYEIYPLDVSNDHNYTEVVHELWKQINKEMDEFNEGTFAFHEFEKVYRQDFLYRYWENYKEIDKKDFERMEMVKYEKIEDVKELMNKRPNLKSVLQKINSKDFKVQSGASKSQIYGSSINTLTEQFSNFNLEKQIPQNEFKIDDEQMLKHLVNHQKILDKYEKEYPDKNNLEIFKNIMDEKLKECYVKESQKFFNMIQSEKRIKEPNYKGNEEKDNVIAKEINKVVSNLSSIRGGFLRLYNNPPQKDRWGKDNRCRNCHKPIKDNQAWSPGTVFTKDNLDYYLMNFFCIACYPVNNDDKLDFLIQLQQDQYVEKKYPYFDANDNMRLNSILESKGNKFSFKGKNCMYNSCVLPPFLMRKNEKRWDIRFDQVIGRKIEWLNIISQPNVKFWNNYKNIAVDLEDDEYAIIYYFDLETRDAVTMIVKQDEFTPHKDKIRKTRPYIKYDKDQKTLYFGRNKQQKQVIQPMDKEMLNNFKIFPTSDIYVDNDLYEKKYLQVFTIVFSVEQFQEMFDMELEWTDQDNPLSISIINMKHLYCFGDPRIFSELTPETGSIDGFCINEDTRTLSYKRSRPSSFGMTNNISFNKYMTYKFSDKKLITESQLTTPISKRLNNFEKMSILYSNLRTIVNMVPGFFNMQNTTQNWYDLYEKNWFQPMEIFGGRSISQLKIGFMYPQSIFDRDVLFNKWSYPLGYSFINELPPQIQEKIRLKRYEMCYDLTYQTVLHNCLDFRSLASVQDYRASIINFAVDTVMDNPLNQQILIGIFGLQLEQEMQLVEMDMFLNNQGEECFQIIWPEIKRDESKEKNLPSTADNDFDLLSVNNLDLNMTGDQQRDMIVDEVADKLGDGVSKKINHFYSNWTEIFFQSRYKDIIKKHDQSMDKTIERSKDRNLKFDFFERNEGFNSKYDIAKLSSELNKKYGEHIENQKVMKSFIDAQFVETQKYIKAMFMAYMVAFVIPFILQIFATTYLQILMLNSCCMLIQITLVGIELIQFQINSVEEYLDDYWNYVDMSHFIVFTTFYIFRLSNPELPCLPQQVVQPNDVATEKTIMVFITSAMLFLLTFKIMFFMKVSEYFGNLVKLVTTVASQIGPFTIFFVMWLITNSLLYKVSGINPVSDGDYPRVNDGIALFISVFRNTIGDITLPTYNLWIDQSQTEELLKIPKPNQKAIIYFGWALFFFNEFFNLIVLLNFLIAIIGQSYDEVQSREEINLYTSKCELNLEIAILLDKFGLTGGSQEGEDKEKCEKEHNKTIFFLMANTFHKDDVNEFQGFVKTIKQALKRENKLLKDNLRQIIKSQLNMQVQKVEEKIGGIRNQCNSLQNDNKANKEIFREMEEKMLQMKQDLINQKDAAKEESKKTKQMMDKLAQLCKKKNLDYQIS